MKKNLLLFTFLILATFGFSQITSVGLVGSATPGGWDTDTDMTLVDSSLWTLDITLVAGEAKFRADDDWAVNWGASDFPSGIGTQDGPNIPILAGNYTVTFNSATGEYNFQIISEIGIIGSATPGGWDTDTDMFKDTTENGYYITLDLAVGEAKFRKDNDWAVNWGSADFPTGIGTQDGDNIPIDHAGTYYITLDTVSGAYSFTEVVTYTTIGIIGDATPGGWDTDTDLTQDVNNPDVWGVDIILTDGEAKFRADDDWAVNWGSADFPTGIGTQDGDNILVTAGNYRVTLNTATGEYNFITLIPITSIGIIGDATPGGWDTDTDLERDTTNADIWTARLELTDGEAKFRADDDWAVNWGSGDFPTGIGEQDGANIPVVAGEYNITFNSFSGEYNFEEIVVFNTVGIIGTATPNGWDSDVDMTKSPDNEHLWVLPSMVLTDGEAKFRAEDDWAVNWGANTWPTGVGVQDGPNIPITGGTYGITINTKTGDYAFGDPMGIDENILDPAIISVFPNPTKNILNIDVSGLNVNDDLTITIFDVTGKQLISSTQNSNSIIAINVSKLQAGNYFMQITNDNYIIGKRFSIVK